MAAILSRDEVIQRALRKIGSYSINARAPRPREVEESAYWLDMVVAMQASRQKTWWLVDESLSFDLTTAVAEYPLATALGPNNVPRGIQFVHSAWLNDPATGDDVGEISLLKRDEFEEISRKTESGEPCRMYVNRDASPTAWVHPVPNGVRALKVRLVFQSYGPDFLNAKPNDKAYKFRAPWNLWMVTALAAELGNGPIRMLPQDEVKKMQSDALRLRNELEAFEAAQQADEPRRTAYWNGID